jgi:hypothetical protein
MGNLVMRWQQRLSNHCRALEQLEPFFQPPEQNARGQQGLIQDGEVWMLMNQDCNPTSHTHNRRSTADAFAGHIGQSDLTCYQQPRARLRMMQWEQPT